MKEIVQSVLNVVSEAYELPESVVLSKCRRADVVDARYTAIKLLHVKGMYVRAIAGLFGMTTRSVNQVLTSFSFRLSGNRVFRTGYERASRRSGEEENRK